jgi:hypothetical protein
VSKLSDNVNKLRLGATGLALSALTALATIKPVRAACDAFDGIQGALNPECSHGKGQPYDLFSGSSGIIPRAINLMLFIVGILAIIFLIFGGIRYVISGGDKTKVDAAKNTILYAIVGLIVAILGYAVVSWVIGVLGANGTNNSGSSGVV